MYLAEFPMHSAVNARMLADFWIWISMEYGCGETEQNIFDKQNKVEPGAAVERRIRIQS